VHVLRSCDGGRKIFGQEAASALLRIIIIAHKCKSDSDDTLPGRDTRGAISVEPSSLRHRPSFPFAALIASSLPDPLAVMDPSSSPQHDTTNQDNQDQPKDLPRGLAKDPSSPRHSYLASPYPAMATTLPASRQQTYEELYGPPENILEIEASPDLCSRRDADGCRCATRARTAPAATCTPTTRSTW
jgi:hypothetical protein